MTTDIFGFSAEKCWDYENGFYLTSHVTRIAKLLAHYELYKSIVNLPGHVIECGVFKGASLTRFATFRELLESPYSRKIIGFDAFGTFPVPKNESDAKFVKTFEEESGSGIPVDELKKAFNLKSINNVELIKGDINTTVPQYVSEHPELKIALLHIDVDVYQPTKTTIEHMFQKVVPGGLIVLDDYGTVAGETNAVDELINRCKVKVQKLPISHIPAFIRK
jgi:hypothetical protein